MNNRSNHFRIDNFRDASVMSRGNPEKHLSTFRQANTIINVLLIGRLRRVMLTIGILGVIFLTYYNFIVTPSNFDSLSNTLWYFIPALATLLSIAVIFNNFILNNETKSMPSDVLSTINEVNQISKLLAPVKQPAINEASMSSTLALYHMINVATDAAKEEQKKNRSRHLQTICTDFVRASDYAIKLFQHTKNQFALIMMPTTNFVIRAMIETSDLTISKENDDQMPKFLQVLLKLHALKSLLARIYIRHSITGLSNDMLISVVPIMALIAAMSSFSTFSDAGVFRILFSAALAAVLLPFILLVIRVVPVVHLMRSNSSLPFPYK